MTLIIANLLDNCHAARLIKNHQTELTGFCSVTG